MTEKTKEQLLELLVENHLGFQALLDNVDLEKIVYKDSGWRVRDIVAHITTWDLETIRSMDAFSSGSGYKIADLDSDEVDYNARTVLERKKLSSRQVLDEWELAYDEMRRAIQEIPQEMYSGDMLYPWGSECGSISRLVGYMLEHLEEHQVDIEKAMKD